MTDQLSPDWKRVDDAAQLLASAISAAAARASRDGVYTPPPGEQPSRRRRQPGSLRHLAEVIRTHRLAPGMSVDKDVVAGVLAGDLRYLTEPTLVIAVVRAAHLIAGLTVADAEVERLTVACAHIAALLDQAKGSPRVVPARSIGVIATIDHPARPLTDRARPSRRRPSWPDLAAAVTATAIVFTGVGLVTGVRLWPRTPLGSSPCQAFPWPDSPGQDVIPPARPHGVDHSPTVSVRTGTVDGHQAAWAQITGARYGDRIWLDWTDNGGQTWTQCGPFPVTGDSAVTKAVLLRPGRRVRACGDTPRAALDALRNACTIFW